MVPTIRDVAERAGVSISTVSRVLNNSASVNEAKRLRVEDAAEALGYSPNPNARSLLGQSTGGIGVLLPYIAGEFFSSFLDGIDRTTSETGHFLMVTSSHRDRTAFRAVLQGMNQRVDGLIVMSTDIPATTVSTWLRGDIPLVFVNTDVEGYDGVSVTFDNRGGARAVTEHLIELGHRRIGILKGPPNSHDAIERLDAFRSTLRANGIEPDPALEFEGDFTMESGLAAVPALLSLDPRPTALFASNDVSAYGVLQGLRERGLDAPNDLSLAGFDNLQLSQFSSPTLTTVRAPVREMGQTAIERLLAMIGGDNGQPAGATQHATELIVRQSTAPPRPT